MESGVRRNHNRGFSTLELLIVVSISFIIAALAIPGFNTMRRSLRIAGDGRSLNGAANDAKLQAAADFTRSRLFADLAANAYHIETWNKTGNGGAGCWQTVNDAANACTVIGTSPVQFLAQGVTFGLGGVGAPPPNTQAAIGQAPACQNINGGAGTIANTACVVFNSRGMPITPGRGEAAVAVAPFGNDALYVTDNNVVYALTLNATGSSQVWATSANSSGTNGSWYNK